MVTHKIEQARPHSRPRRRKLPIRFGTRPSTTSTAPHSQIDQLPTRPLSSALLERLARLPGVVHGPSRRAPQGTIGLHLQPDDAHRPDRAFLIDREFAHVHAHGDSSLHLILPEPLRSEAIAAGWAEPHPMAGHPTVSPDTVMVYAPRDEDELDVVANLVTASWRNARGNDDGHSEQS